MESGSSSEDCSSDSGDEFIDTVQRQSHLPKTIKRYRSTENRLKTWLHRENLTNSFTTDGDINYRDLHWKIVKKFISYACHWQAEELKSPKTAIKVGQIKRYATAEGLR